MKLKLIFSWLLSMGYVVPMEEMNEGKEMYVLYVVNHETEEVFAYEYAYKDEIIRWIKNGVFEYEGDKEINLNEDNARNAKSSERKSH